MEATMTKLSTEDGDDLSKDSFAFPKQRKEPLENAAHVRNAVARFNQVKDVSDDERDDAWKRIRAAAKNTGSKSVRNPGARSVSPSSGPATLLGTLNRTLATCRMRSR
jgi:hypothetical protein